MIEFILYVSDQQQSRDFYAAVLDKSPVLDVPGMTEFMLNDSCKLGLMPENGIARILTPATRHPSEGNGIPRCELYLYCVDPQKNAALAVKYGAQMVQNSEPRNWGDTVSYVCDPDGHIIAFAKKS